MVTYAYFICISHIPNTISFERTNKRMNERTYERTNKRMNERTNE